MKLSEIFRGVFLSHKERVIFISLNPVFIVTNRESTDKKASVFKTAIANGPLLYFIVSSPSLLILKQGAVVFMRDKLTFLLER